MANATDLRIVKTLDAIHGSFEELAGKQAFESITVAELCRQARIGKKTFYRHYPALENLAQEYLDVFIGSFLDKTEGLNLPENNEQFARRIHPPSLRGRKSESRIRMLDLRYQLGKHQQHTHCPINRTSAHQYPKVRAPFRCRDIPCSYV